MLIASSPGRGLLISRRLHWRVTATVLLFLLTAPVAAEPIPLEYFASLPEVEQVVLSPSGTEIAFSVNSDGIAGVLVQTVGEARFRSLLRNDNERAVINWLRWANDRQLLVSVRFPASRFGTDTMETRLLVIDAESAEVRQAIPARRSMRWLPQFQDAIVDMLPDEPNHLLIALDLEIFGAPGVYRLDLATGTTRRVHKARPHNRYWMTDQQHRVRVGVRLREDRFEIHYLDLASNRWKQAWRYEAFSGSEVEPLGFGLDPNVLYVSAYHQGYRAVFRADLGDPELRRELVLAFPGRDVEGRLLHSPKSGEAVGLISNGGRVELWDDSYTPFLLGIKRAFGDLELWLTALSRDESRYLLFALGATEPGTFYFGDRASGTLTPIGARYPNLHPEMLSGKRAVSYSARDGVRIEGFLTLPAGGNSRPLPAVIFPHGGPIHADDGAFDYWSEFFASRGYAVLQMNFRGSTGYGFDFLKAGLQNWGLEMQTDVEDGVRWLIAEGLVDPQRICIVGASYGGYAALMGAAMTPDLFRCAVSFAGVTDLPDLVRYSRRFQNAAIVEQMVGANIRSLRARSPAELADRMRVPVLVVHGDDDRQVRIVQGRRMRDALAKAGATFTYLEQPGGDHQLSRESHRLQLFRAMESFLEAHLTAPP